MLHPWCTVGWVRNVWQCSARLSPAEWALEVRPYWDPTAMGTGTVELVGDLRANLAKLQAEGHTVSVDRNVR